MVEFIAFVITVGLFGLIGLITWMCCKISDKIYDKKAEKAQKKYRDFYELVAYVRGVDKQKSKFMCEIYDLKKEICYLSNVSSVICHFHAQSMYNRGNQTEIHKEKTEQKTSICKMKMFQ